jgi:hypothetical protein
MGLFDYDARPATIQVQLVGDRSPAAAYALRDFLTRNGLPYDWQEVDGTRVRSALGLHWGTDQGRTSGQPSVSGDSGWP